ncbi:MAG: helix-turn-helix transcriptional regulator [Flavobacterium sp.]|nr:helix-turn-helix transcriptional regulator [Flavobacterium sp.]
MEINKVITDLRKEKDWSQSDLANKTGISQVMVGKYERGDASPSIEVAKKIADAFEVSLDFLVGEGQNASFDKKTMQRIEDIQKLDNATQEMLFNLIDTVIRDQKAKKAYS